MRSRQLWGLLRRRRVRTYVLRTFYLCSAPADPCVWLRCPGEPQESSRKRSSGDRTLFLQFTCNKCETVSQYMIGKVAYESGIVICTCKNCKARHLIADNLKKVRRSLSARRQARGMRARKDTHFVERYLQTRYTGRGGCHDPRCASP